MTYAVITPAKDEAENLRRLADSLAAQAVLPAVWLVVDSGSVDGTPQLVAELAAEHPWIRLLEIPRPVDAPRGAPIVRAFHAGLDALEDGIELVAKVDADVSFEPDYFARLVGAFEDDPKLGLASGSCFELEEGAWKQRFGTGANVWGAARLYRAACLGQILPLDERMGWDGIDVVKANVRGWRTETILDLPFFHHRAEGIRERGPWHQWTIEGDASHFMGYRVPYLVVRTFFQASRTPAAFGMLWGYGKAAARRAPTCPDESVRAYVRETQRLRTLPSRGREALGQSR